MYNKIYFIILAIFIFFIIACDGTTTTANLNPKINYERDLVITVNGITRLGSITMPLLPVNTVHVASPVPMNEFRLKLCGGKFKKRDDWEITKEIPSGLFGWGSKKIVVKNQVQFQIAATDFHEVGVCPLYLEALDTKSGHHAEGYVNWQTSQYKLGGTVVCNMSKRPFTGVEACSTATGSYVKLEFNEEVYVSPKAGCELDKNKGTSFTWRAHSGPCIYEFSTKDRVRGYFDAYGEDEMYVR